jgi:hypothetical protein
MLIVMCLGVCVDEKKDCVCVNSHILMVPFDSQDNRGIVYVWIGDKVNPEEARLAEEIADDMFGVGFFSFFLLVGKLLESCY